jgi:hypothetical protein
MLQITMISRQNGLKSPRETPTAFGHNERLMRSVDRRYSAPHMNRFTKRYEPAFVAVLGPVGSCA